MNTKMQFQSLHTVMETQELPSRNWNYSLVSKSIKDRLGCVVKEFC